MFTQCPDCKRQFRILAEQLSAAEGEVKCGYCGQQFNALLALYDQPLPPATESTDVPEAEPDKTDVETVEPDIDSNDLPEPDFELPMEAEPGEVDETGIEPEISLKSEEETEEQASAAMDLSALEREIMSPEPESESEPEPDPESDPDSDLSSEPDEPISAKNTHYVFPEEYLDEEEPAPSRARSLLWGAGCLILMILLVTQAGWFYRDRIVARYPQITPYLQQLCERFQCRVTRYDKLEGIRLVNRDVRDHPRYEKSLLVNASMINEADRSQPFPRVQLSLFNNEGKVMSWRQFQPDEYLDDSIDQSAGMGVNVPVHFVLEVTGPTAGAVSFEFEFLEPR